MEFNIWQMRTALGVRGPRRGLRGLLLRCRAFTCRRVQFREILQEDRGAVRKPDDKLELATHTGNIVAQGRDQQVASRFS